MSGKPRRREPVTGDDLRASAVAVNDLVHRAGNGADWGTRAGGLEWSCRRTLDHLPDTLLFYASHLARRASGPLPFIRDGDPHRSPTELAEAARSTAAVLAEVAAAAPPGVRAFHPAGMADTEGFLAMAADELLIHGADIAEGLGLPFEEPHDLAVRIRDRLFPWAPTDVAPWDALRWANGRTALVEHAQLPPDWYWHCAPLEEWDGQPVRRQAPPAW